MIDGDGISGGDSLQDFLFSCPGLFCHVSLPVKLFNQKNLIQQKQLLRDIWKHAILRDMKYNLPGPEKIKC